MSDNQTTLIHSPSGRPFVVFKHGGLKDLCAAYVQAHTFWERCKSLVTEVKTRKGSLVPKPTGKKKQSGEQEDLALSREIDYAIARMALQAATDELKSAVQTLRGEQAHINGYLSVQSSEEVMRGLSPNQPKGGWFLAHHNCSMAQELMKAIDRWWGLEARSFAEFFAPITLPEYWV